jgi:hypothetical protein
MNRPYYVVVSRDYQTGKWGIEFGDYVRSVAAEEMADLKVSTLFAEYRLRRHARTKFMLLKVSQDTQAAIDDAVVALNAP